MSSAGHRKRSRLLGKVGGVNSYPAFPQNGTTTHSYEIWGQQETLSISHQVSQLGKTNADLGGLFQTTSDFYDSSQNNNMYGTFNGGWDGTNNIYRSVGTVMASYPHFGTSRNLCVPASNSELDALGAKAIAAVYPTKPAFDAATYTAELLREGIPKSMGSALIKSKARDFRKIGDEYLNYQFGWAPLIGGVKDMAEVAVKADKTLKQLRRDSGKNVRRRYQLPSVNSYKIERLSDAIPVGMPLNYYQLQGAPYQLWRETTIRRDRWFSGCFTYYLPEATDNVTRFQRSAAEAKKLLGIRVDPEVLWNLAPWSWAADYVSNAGSVMTNLSAFSQDGLVMRYGYVMETTTVTIRDTLKGVHFWGYSPRDLYHTYGTRSKVRRSATPYGFGLDLDGFTPYQWGIIGALGISNVPKGRSRL